MNRRQWALEYERNSIYQHVVEATPDPGNGSDFLCYVMGPYTPFDVTYALPEDAIDVANPYVDAELFDPDEHENMEETLQNIRAKLQDDPGVRAFVATNVGIPTRREARKSGLDERGLSPLDQSIEYAAISDAVVFVLDEAGLNAGVGSEVGAILGEFNL